MIWLSANVKLKSCHLIKLNICVLGVFQSEAWLCVLMRAAHYPLALFLFIFLLSDINNNNNLSEKKKDFSCKSCSPKRNHRKNPNEKVNDIWQFNTFPV